MKHNIKYILSVCIGIALTMGLSAQTLNSSYFMEKMTKRNQLNPALKTPNGYVSFPALGNFYLGVNSNLGLGTFLYPRGNELVTFLHPSVPADDFLGKLTPNNTVELDLDSGHGVDKTRSTSPSKVIREHICPKKYSNFSKPDKKKPGLPVTT